MKTTWKNDPALKCSVLTSLRKHYEADQFMRGSYAWTNANGLYKGCALGCTLIPFGATRDEVQRIEFKVDGDDRDRAWARAVALKYGLPIWLTRLEEAVFESCLDDTRWPVDLAAAIPVGVPFRELEVRVAHELKHRVKSLGVPYFSRIVRGDEEFWGRGNRGVWREVRRDLLGLLHGVQIDVPQPTVEECPALVGAAA